MDKCKYCGKNITMERAKETEYWYKYSLCFDCEDKHIENGDKTRHCSFICCMTGDCDGSC